MRYYFYEQSPTQINIARQLAQLGHEKSQKAPEFTDKLLSLNEQATSLLEHKDLFASLLKRHHLNFLPETHYIDDLNYPGVLKKLNPKTPWILKPALLNNGQGIHLFDSPKLVKVHFEQAKRYSGRHIIQQYIHPPLLFEQCKYTLRLFVLVSNFSGSYLYPQGYVNLALTPYTTNLSCLEAHLSNEHLNQDHSPNTRQIPTTEYPLFNLIFNQLKDMTQKVIHAFEQETKNLAKTADAFTLFGFDFLLDEEKKPWLLEANHSPCFPTTNHPLSNSLYQGFWQAVCEDFVIPLTQRQAFNQSKSFQPLICS